VKAEQINWKMPKLTLHHLSREKYKGIFTNPEAKIPEERRKSQIIVKKDVCCGFSLLAHTA